MPKVQDSGDNVNICKKYCEPCLSYPDVEGEYLFCARGQSSAPKAKKGCNCGICEVQAAHGNKDLYYCINGACK